MQAFILVLKQSAQDSNFLFSTAATPIWIYISRLHIESPQRLAIGDVTLLNLYPCLGKYGTSLHFVISLFGLQYSFSSFLQHPDLVVPIIVAQSRYVYSRLPGAYGQAL